jgi:hypothetical protein
MLDKRLEWDCRRLDNSEENLYLKGFQKAIERLRENEYYGHYAQNLADWLEKHLDGDVSGDKANGK